MDYKKTGRLIKKKRNSLGLTQAKLSEALFVSPQAVSLWEKGKRFPDAEAQIMLFKVLGLKPVELLTGLEMFDEKLKADIAAHMRRMDEQVFIAGTVRDEDGNDEYLDLSDYSIVMPDENGDLSDKLIPYVDYHNVEPAPKRNDTNALPLSEYNPEKVYINHHDAIFAIPVEILVAMGKPLYFNIIQNKEDGWVGFKFTDVLEENGFDIQEEVYNGEWKGVQVLGGEFGRILCKEMGIRRRKDLIEIVPELLPEKRAVLLFLDRAKRVNVNIDYSGFSLPKWQYDEFWADEEDEEFEDDEE